MRVLYLCIFTIFIISCKNDEHRVLTPQQKKDIVEVANCIIDETISKNKAHISVNSTNLSNQFIVTKIYPIDIQNDKILPPPPEGITLYELLQKDSFFTLSDTFYLKQQYYKLQNVIITGALSNVCLVSQDELLNWEDYNNLNHAKYKINVFYTMSAPIFSLDHTKAYVELGFHCGGLCGYGSKIYLIKVKDKWVIHSNEDSWMS